MDELIGRFAKKIKQTFISAIGNFLKYIKRLLFPLYLFPIKIVTYSAFYIVKFVIKFILACLGLAWDIIVFPFKSLKNFLKAGVISIVSLYLFASLFVIIDYIGENYGDVSRFFCGSYATKQKLKNSVVRIIGSYGEGSGFFVEADRVVTNFHVIDGEPSPKIVFSDGSIVTPVKILGSKNDDIAILFTNEKYEDKVFSPVSEFGILDDLPVLSAGYPLGSDLLGGPTIVKGNVKADRYSMIQTDINLVPGMSGGPLVDNCGSVVGMNTSGLSGLSLFVDSSRLKPSNPDLSEQDIEKITVDETTPEGAVEAFYTYIKARDLNKAFEMFSSGRKSTISSFEEWTEGYANTLQVNLVFAAQETPDPNLITVQLSSYDWINGQLVVRLFEGAWDVVEENGEYKLDASNIKEIHYLDQ